MIVAGGQRATTRAGGRVLVLGAGLAGLAAARALMQAGVAVSVLGARERPGGRVLTLRARLADGLFVEAGARYVLATHDLAIAFLQTFAIAL